jgi:hypothetical protein
VQQADVVAAHLSCNLGSDVDLLRRPELVQPDAPAEEGIDQQIVRPARAGEVEECGAVEEEVAALGKKQREPGQVDLALIDLGLREIGVDGQIGADARRHVVEEVETGVAVALQPRA